jgi:alkanesulfonate monooxygenase SsuD/methylene tetrahydromethanopterin reductase-like flavin-dependent oxidoreductase (luciferase family)
MGVGIHFDLRNPPGWARPPADVYARALEVAAAAEAMGATSLWASEHHAFEDGYIPQPLTFLAAVAARTSRARLGTMVMLSPFRSAVQVAEEAAVVDLLSGGRLDLALGAGYHRREFDLHEVDFDSRFKATDRQVADLRRIWTEGRVTPPPVQQPLPLWLGYLGVQGARRAGRMGVGLLSLRREQYQPYLAGLREGGHGEAAARLSGPVQGVLSRDPERAWARIGRHLSQHRDSYHAYAAEGTGQPAPPPIDPEEWRRQPDDPDELPRFLVDTPEGAAKRLNRYLGGRPVGEVIFWASTGGMPDEEVDEHVELVCRELAPRLRTLDRA